jgi:hypothetical protein
VNNAANFNGQKPVIDPGDAVLLLIDHPRTHRSSRCGTDRHRRGVFRDPKDVESS